MDSVNLLLRLIKAEDEDDVENIIAIHPVLSRDENWKPYGLNSTWLASISRSFVKVRMIWILT